jgi:hypothetical protein
MFFKINGRERYRDYRIKREQIELVMKKGEGEKKTFFVAFPFKKNVYLNFYTTFTE